MNPHRHLIETLRNWAQTLLFDPLGLTQADVAHDVQAVDAVKLEYPSVWLVVTIAGKRTIVCFSFDASLMNRLFGAMTKGITYPPNEAKRLFEDTARDALNLVIGNATGQLDKGARVQITTPFLIDSQKLILRKDDVCFFESVITTEAGSLCIHGIEPAECFDGQLNYVNLQNSASDKKGKFMKPLNVMVVDDSALTIKQLRQCIEDLGHKVISTAGTGKEALQKYGNFKPDIVTMDIAMPDMDGLAATKAILKQFPNARIVMVTSHRQQEIVLDAIRAGAMGYILKPFKSDKLQEVFDRIAQQANSK